MNKIRYGSHLFYYREKVLWGTPHKTTHQHYLVCCCAWGDVSRGAVRSARRDEIKRALHEAYATAKELGEEVAVTRRSVGELRQALAAGGGGDAATEEEAAAASSLRLRLQLDTAAYKDAVAQLRELKPQVGELQQQMQRVQQQLEADFAAWHACAVAAAAG